MTVDTRSLERSLEGVQAALSYFSDNIRPYIIGTVLFFNLSLLIILLVKHRTVKLSSASFIALVCLLVSNIVFLITELIKNVSGRWMTVRDDTFNFFRVGIVQLMVVSFIFPMNILSVLCVAKIVEVFRPQQSGKNFGLRTMTCCLSVFFTMTFLLGLLLNFLNFSENSLAGIAIQTAYVKVQSLILLVCGCLLLFLAIKRRSSPLSEENGESSGVTLVQLGPVLLIISSVTHVIANSFYIQKLIMKVKPYRWTTPYIETLKRYVIFDFLDHFRILGAVFDWLWLLLFCEAVRGAIVSIFHVRRCCGSDDETAEVQQSHPPEDIELSGQADLSAAS